MAHDVKGNTPVSQHKTPRSETSSGIPPEEMSEVKSLVEKATAHPGEGQLDATVKTGSDLPGGGGTKSLGPLEKAHPKKGKK